MDTTRATDTLEELPDLSDDELAGVIGGNDTVDAVHAAVNRRLGMCGCGVAH